MVTAEEILEVQLAVESVRVDESLLNYLMTIIQATRDHQLLDLGASPRGAMALFRAAQAFAFLAGRDYCTPDDIKDLAVPVLAHRVVVSSRLASPLQVSEEAELIVRELVDGIEVPA